MKSLAGNVGNINLRGKKSRHMSCRCCVAQNLKCDVEYWLNKKETMQAVEDYYLLDKDD